MDNWPTIITGVNEVFLFFYYYYFLQSARKWIHYRMRRRGTFRLNQLTGGKNNKISILLLHGCNGVDVLNSV